MPPRLELDLNSPQHAHLKDVDAIQVQAYNVYNLVIAPQISRG